MNGDIVSSLITLVSALALVVGVLLVGIYLATYLRGKGPRGGWIKVLAASDLSGKCTIAVVEVVDEVLVLGVAPQQISLLSKIEGPETIRRLKLVERPQPTLPFLAHLERLTAKMVKTARSQEQPHA